jgi:hypothetical protein
MRLLFPSTLTARQRAALHKVSDENGLQHGSSGEGTGRRITIGNADAESLEVNTLHNDAFRWQPSVDWQLINAAGLHLQVCTADDRDAVSDERICAALSEHLHLDAAAAFARPSRLAANKQATKREQVLHANSFGSDLRFHLNVADMSDAPAIHFL